MSIPVIIFFLLVSFAIMLGSFTCEDYIKGKMDITKMPGQGLFLLPSMVYAVTIVIINKFYRQLASFLNDWGKFDFILQQSDLCQFHNRLLANQ